MVKQAWTSRWMAWGLAFCLLLGTDGYASAKDERPPGIKALPGHGEQHVSVTTVLQIVFDEPVTLATGSAITSRNAGTLVELQEANNRREVPCTASWSPSQKTVTMKPLQPLAYNTEYVFTVPAGKIADTAGNENREHIVRWKTEQELPPLQVTFAPANQAVDVPQESHVSLTFNKPMQLKNKKEITPKSVETFVKLTDAKNRHVAFQVAFDSSRNTITLDPVGNLAGGTTYTVTLLEKKLIDKQGNPNQLFSSTFSTLLPIDQIPPQATITPAHGAKQVNLESKVTLQFAEEVVLPDGSPLSSKTTGHLVQIIDGAGTSVSFYSTWNKSKRTLTIKPRGKWQAYTTYRVSFPANQVKDMAGNFNQLQLTTFTTGGK